MLPDMPALAQGAGVIATVNDRPVTNFDVDQRIKLLKVLGRDEAAKDRRKVLNDLIDDVVKIDEAKKYKVNASDSEIEKQMERMAKGLGTDSAGLKDKLAKQGLTPSGLKQYIEAQIAISRILSGKYQVKVEVTPAEVDAKLAEIKANIGKRVEEIMKDPRMKPVLVYKILEITLPVDGEDPSLAEARAADAAIMMRKFKGCGSAREAASGVYNVKIGKPIEADASKLPKQLKAALEKTGTGKAIGPMRTKNGIQMIAFCEKRTIVPPKPQVQIPSRDQVESAVSNEKYAAAQEKYMMELRKNAYIEYKDPSLSQ